MPTITKFTVAPKLPDRLAPLLDIAYNLHWAWEPEAIELFFRIDRDLWVKTNQNPVLLLGAVGQQRLEELAADDSFMAHLDRVWTRMGNYLESSTWCEKHTCAVADLKVAYFSLEFGVQESLTIYSGGLGLLAGDHLKSASDLGLPLVGIGLLYREGYHTQYLNADGWQQERYPQNDFYNMAVSPILGANGKQVVIEVDYPEGKAYARAWKVQVGRVPLYLLDCDFDANTPDNRELTARLYAGDLSMRIRQEILLGMGGVRMLRALGVNPSVFHMNEGHAAFLTLERIREFVATGKLSLPQAIEAVKAGSVFTTHTPVPAGNDMFDAGMIHYFFKDYCTAIGLSMEEFLGLGRQNVKDAREPFCMTVLALRLSAKANGVSQLHGEVAREMWQRTWSDVPVEEVPIGAITNGVHTRFWVSRDMGELYDRYLGPNWVEMPHDTHVWKKVENIPDPELWRTHERRRERLVNFARRRLTVQLRERGAPAMEIQAAAEALDPEVLTIGFARRFATYKRANLLLMDPDRLHKILTNEKRPVQMIIAGKAHPQDNQAKEIIRALIHFIRERGLRASIVFIENYDINVARYMVQGVDCWLNVPRRPMEASGTSGMKAACNGGLNISIPDGWWCEAEGMGENGWSIGKGEMYNNPDEQDLVESGMLYELLEREIVPAFYERGRDGIPRQWTHMMKTAIKTISPFFTTHRMVEDYTQQSYLPCAVRRARFEADNFAEAKALAEWKRKVRDAWQAVRVTQVESNVTEGLTFGAPLGVNAKLDLSGLTEKDVAVEVYFGEVDPHNNITGGRHLPMEFVKRDEMGLHLFKGVITCDKTGQQAFTVRVIPSHPSLEGKHETMLIRWA